MIIRGRRSRLGGRLTPAVTWIFGISVAAFVIFTLGGSRLQGLLAEHLVLTPAALLDLELWKLFTTAFLPTSPVGFLFDCLLLWFFMPFLERAWGTRRFVIFGVVTTLVGNLISALAGIVLGGPHLGAPIAGLDPFMYAGIVGYGVAFAEQPLSFFGVIPMKGKAFAIGIAAVVVVATLINQSWVQGAGHAAAMITGFLMTSGRIAPRVWLLKWRRARIKRKYRVLDGGKHKDNWLN